MSRFVEGDLIAQVGWSEGHYDNVLAVVLFEGNNYYVVAKPNGSPFTRVVADTDNEPGWIRIARPIVEGDLVRQVGGTSPIGRAAGRVDVSMPVGEVSYTIVVDLDSVCHILESSNLEVAE